MVGAKGTLVEQSKVSILVTVIDKVEESSVTLRSNEWSPGVVRAVGR